MSPGWIFGLAVTTVIVYIILITGKLLR